MMKKENRKKIMILGTGGTLAGIGEVGKSIGYRPGSINIDKLVKTMPWLTEVSDIETEQICNINSDDITADLWIKLANKINEKSKRNDIAGFVVTHGTDTMEETAYFLNLTVKTKKPVVLTGSMRPATAISPDGPMNIYGSVVVAKNKQSAGRGVMIVFSNQIYSARYVTKSNTNTITAMTGGIDGSIGAIIDNNLYFSKNVDKIHTVKSKFDVSKYKELKKVSIVYFNADADEQLLQYAIDISDGVVVAGAGMGEYSKKFSNVIKESKKPVVISSRVGQGIITENSLLNSNSISANDLSPQKACILLRLCLTENFSIKQIRKIFKNY